LQGIAADRVDAAARADFGDGGPAAVNQDAVFRAPLSVEHLARAKERLDIDRVRRHLPNDPVKHPRLGLAARVAHDMLCHSPHQ